MGTGALPTSPYDYFRPLYMASFWVDRRLWGPSPFFFHLTNLLLIAATNRADNLDPALLRPGRFDRRLTFEAPTKAGRRDLIDFFLARKAHDLELDTDAARDSLASVTQGYTPVMIEHLFDEEFVLVTLGKAEQQALAYRLRHPATRAEEQGGLDAFELLAGDHLSPSSRPRQA